MRVAAINFLNTAPLMWDFLHAPRAEDLSRRYDVEYMLPNHCAARLAEGTTDIGLVPVAAYTSVADLRIVPGLSIASLAKVRSILLLVRQERELRDIRSVALDSTSRTSAALTRVLLERVAGVRPEYRAAAPDAEAMLRGSDAALLIGDPALLALEAGACSRFRCYDLAELWHQHTGLPFVFAFWAARARSLPDSPAGREQVTQDFTQSLEAGQQHLETLVDEWEGRIAVPRATIRNYWTENIHYRLDGPCLAGLKLFFRYAEECGALKAAPALRFV